MALDSSLIPPSPVTMIDLEAGSTELIQCRICFETEGRDFIAPCKCKGSSKYVHRECLDNWRAVREGFAFAHCTTCKAPYHLRVNGAYSKWRTLKFQFFVTRDIFFIFLAVQLVIASLAYLVYLVDDGCQQYWLRLVWSSDSERSFYYICGTLLFFVLLGLSGCFIYDGRVCNDLAQSCEICLCCCQHGVCADCHLPCSLSMATECGGCMGCAGGAGLPLLFILALIFLGLFTVIGIFYSVLLATMVGQRIWQCHYHILAKGMLTKEYVVEDIAGEITGSDWSPPSLPPEHVQQLKALRLL